MDKAVEYARQAIAEVAGHLKGTAFATGIMGQMLRDTETLLEQAYRAGYAQGQADFYKRERVTETQTAYERELRGGG